MANRRGRPGAPTTILGNGVNVLDWNNLRNIRINLKQIYEISTNTRSTIEWLAQNGLIRNQRDCYYCFDSMVLLSASDRSDGVKWYCNTCKVENSIRQDSFFSKSHLPITKLLEILYWWTLDCNLETVSKEIEVSEHSLVDWFSF